MREDLARVAAAARRASAPWRDAGTVRRLAVLEAVGRALHDRRPELVGAMLEEGISEAIADYFAEWIVHAADPELLRRYARDLWRREPAGDGAELLVRRPDGVVLVTTPRNSPTIQSGVLFSVLLPGNAVLLRVPPEAAAGARFLVDALLRPALADAGFPAEVVTVVAERAQPALEALVPSPHVDTIVFFGNYRVGRAVADHAHAHGKKVVLELEGSDHLLVWKDADLPAAVRSASRAWTGSTQPCVVPKHILVHNEVFEAFLTAFLAAVPAASRTADADRVGGLLVAVMDREGFDAHLAEVREVGVVRCGGHWMTEAGIPDVDGAFAAPTVVTLEADAVDLVGLRCFAEEIRFPLIPVVRFPGTDEAVLRQMIGVAGASPFGLRLSVWARDPAVLARIVREAGSVGLILCNDDHARSPTYASPWGGPGRSGGPRGEHHLFWAQTSRLQAIGCEHLEPAAIEAIVDALGCVR